MWIFDSISDRLPVQLLVEADLSELRAPIQLQSGGERSAEGRGRVRPRCAPSLREAPAQDGTSIFRRLEHFHPTHLDLHRPQISVGHWTLVNVFFFYLCGTQVCLILWERWDGPDGPGPHGACGAERRCCLNMLNDIKIEDRLRTDASSLEVLLGECSPPPEPFSSSEHSWTVFSFVEEKKNVNLIKQTLWFCLFCLFQLYLIFWLAVFKLLFEFILLPLLQHSSEILLYIWFSQMW